MKRILSLLLLTASLLVGCMATDDPTDNLVVALQDAQYQVDDLGYISTPYFAPDGKRLRVAGENITIFEFPHSIIATLSAATVASDGYSIAGQAIRWVQTPHFYLKDRYIILYVGDDQEIVTILERIMGVQFAGGIVYPDI